MNSKTFKTINGLDLIIKNRKSAIIFEIGQNEDNKNYNFSFQFTPRDFKELLKYIEEIANKTWSNLMPKEADSMGTDYDEYYDREFDSNGCLSIRNNILLLERPVLESNKLYQFNKKKMESFIYDLRKMLSTK